MGGKKFLITAVTCATLLGISGTIASAEISSDFSTLKVENQELAWRGGPRSQPPPPQHSMGRGGSRESNYKGGRNNPGPRNTGTRSGGNFRMSPPRM